MANQAARPRRLAQLHYDTAKELGWIYDPLPSWPSGPRSIKQKATLWLKRLVREAGINSENMTREQMYLESIKAIIQKHGYDDVSYAARNLRDTIDDWKKLRTEFLDDKKQGAQSTSSQPAKPTRTTPVGDDCHSFEVFGIYAGDKLEKQELSLADFRAGDLISVWSDDESRWDGLGRFVEADDEQFYIQESDGHVYTFTRAGYNWTLYLVVAATHRTTFARGDEAGAEQSKREAQIKMLQHRAARLTSSDEESEKFQVLKQIYDLERETSADEWPDVIAA